MSDLDPLQQSLKNEDAFALAKLATKEDIDRIAAAEALIDKRRSRRRWNRFMLAGPALAAYVALAGFFANAYQNWSNNREMHRRSVVEQDRWTKEFKRAQDADKYRAFFESSVLVTDPNLGKHVIGYTLLKEFVRDSDYNSKAMTLLKPHSRRNCAITRPSRASIPSGVSRCRRSSLPWGKRKTATRWRRPLAAWTG